MFIVILNIQVIRSGLLLLNLRYRHFDFHFLDYSDVDLSSAFFTVLNSMSETCIGASIKYIKFQDFIFHFYNDASAFNLLFVIITDTNSDPVDLRFRLKKIASVFNEEFSNNLGQFDGNVHPFRNFRELLVEI